MKFIVLGTSEFTLYCVRALIDTGANVCALISMPEDNRPSNSADIIDFARKKEIPYHEISDINSLASIKLLKKYSPDYVFSSWPKILGRAILKTPKQYCIGTHPTALPFNRGRHPLHWLIMLGIRRSKLSFFVIDKGVDTGNILLQVSFEISSSDSIGAAVSIMNKAAYLGTKRLVRKICADPSFKGEKQNQRKANYWRRRTPHDVILDMRMSTNMILRIVRSFSLPYPCAILVFENHILRVSHARIVKNSVLLAGMERMEHGRILGVRNGKITVKVDGGIIEFSCNDRIPLSLRKAKYIHPPTRYLDTKLNIGDNGR
jgi:methionyl-tRNA formyltransferase